MSNFCLFFYVIKRIFFFFFDSLQFTSHRGFFAQPLLRNFPPGQLSLSLSPERVLTGGSGPRKHGKLSRSPFLWQLRDNGQELNGRGLPIPHNLPTGALQVSPGVIVFRCSLVIPMLPFLTGHWRINEQVAKRQRDYQDGFPLHNNNKKIIAIENRIKNRRQNHRRPRVHIKKTTHFYRRKGK